MADLELCNCVGQNELQTNLDNMFPFDILNLRPIIFQYTLFILIMKTSKVFLFKESVCFIWKKSSDLNFVLNGSL